MSELLEVLKEAVAYQSGKNWISEEEPEWLHKAREVLKQFDKKTD